MSGVMARLKMPIAGALAGIVSSAYLFWPLIQEIRYVKQQKASGAPLDMEAIDFMKQFGVPEKETVAVAEANKEATSLLPKRRDSIE